MKISYSWLQEEYFDNKLPDIKEVADALLFHAFEIEGVEGDLIDVDVLPNRAHDCLSHRGIAKEISVIMGIPLVEKGIESNFTNIDSSLNVAVKEPDFCKRYIGRIVKNLEVKESPDWIKKRLESVGQKSINALVDATNYVMLDIGQPTHVFDLDKLDNPSVEVAKGFEGEIETLDGKQVEISKEDLVIASGTKMLAIAGVKGGKEAEVDENTKNIIIESAHFNPVTVRKTSRKFNILTDSSKRFENEPTVELASEAMEYLTRLIISLCKTEDTVVEYPVDVYQEKEIEVKVQINLEHVNKLLGIDLAEIEISDILNRFGWDYQKSGDEFIVNVPSERMDIRNSADLVEEIGRIYGYENIPAKELPEITGTRYDKEFYYTTGIKNALIEKGFSEIYTQSFQSKGKLKMSNPFAKDRPYLRESIDLGDVFEMNVKNKDLLGIDEVKIFEIGRVFDKDANEKLILSLKSEKTLEEDLLEEFDIKVSGKEVEVDLGKIIESMPEINSYDDLELGQDEIITYKPFSRYPFVVRDIAVWVGENDSREQLVDLIKENAGDLLVIEPRLVDEYKKEDRVSYAHRLVFQSDEKTLKDEEVGGIMKKIEEEVEGKGWEVR